MKKIINLIAIATLTFSISTTTHAKEGYSFNRLYGSDRYKTSVNISNNFSSETVQNVIVSSGINFPDALAGSVLSKKLNAPILLVGKDINEDNDSIEYIASHLDKGGNIYVLGGLASVGDDFINYMQKQGYNIIRLGGSNRFDTNKSIVNYMNMPKGTPVVLVNAFGFADALSVSSVAALKGYPILMTNSSNLPDEAKETITNLQPSELFVIGGNASVGEDVVTQIKNLVPSLDNNKIVRIGGQTRYETSLNICKYFNLDTDNAIIANGENFPDALSGSALAAKLNAPIILTDGQNIADQKVYLDSKHYKNITLLGGSGSIDILTEYALKGRDNVTDAEKDSINKLLDYCKAYTDAGLSYENDEKKLQLEFNSLSSLSELMDYLNNFIDFANNCKDLNNAYKQSLLDLKDKVSNLQTSGSSELLKTDYINSIDTELRTLDSFTNFLDNNISLMNELKDAINSHDMTKTEEILEKLKDYSSTLDKQIESSPDGSIENLRSKLLKIQSYIE